MTLQMRCLLFAGALGTLAYIMKKIRKNRLEIDHSIFWILFSFILVLVSVFPGVITWAANILGFISPANMVFLLVIFMLILKLFSMTIRLSVLENKVKVMTQYIAIQEISEPKCVCDDSREFSESKEVSSV